MERQKTIERHDSMRGWFAYELYNQMAQDESIWLVTGDLGYGMWDRVRDDFPDRFINTGASEQALLGLAIGLALEGKKPFVYSITTFLLYRAFELIRNYVNYENIPVRLVGSGRDRDYHIDGISHWSEDARPILETAFPNISTLWPQDKEEIPDMLERMVKEDKPWFISLRR